MDVLSDDEIPLAPPLVQQQQRSKNKLKRKTNKESRDVDAVRVSCLSFVKAKCKCMNGDACRSVFREPAEFDKLLSFRLKLHSMEKSQADEEAHFFATEIVYFDWFKKRK